MKLSKLYQALRRIAGSADAPKDDALKDTVKAAPLSVPRLEIGTTAIDRPHESGVWETCQIEACGLLRVVGWTQAMWADFQPPQAFANGSPLTLLSRFRTYRPDLVPVTNSAFSGCVFEFALPYDTPISESAIESHGVRVWHRCGELVFSRPAYDTLLSCDRVLHREQIYGVGIPSSVTSGVVLSLVERLPAPILDFGCGIGALVRDLRSRDMEAYGIEIDRPAIANGIFPEVKDAIKLYDGSFPLPYEDESFASVVSIEVLEHVSDPDKVLSELARIARDRAVFTVPNINAIPLCFPHQVVPWHLLEATHFNFFTQASLYKILSQYFSRVEFMQIHPVTVNGTLFFISLAAICEK
ncbi:MAG: class I SAM-dependent methyltransferase [Cyanobacteria bacterium SBC]|nr:class I SAM-dependent methyltransferase [Cyanobacteria bacterium SBC]